MYKIAPEAVIASINYLSLSDAVKLYSQVGAELSKRARKKKREDSSVRST